MKYPPAEHTSFFCRQKLDLFQAPRFWTCVIVSWKHSYHWASRQWLSNGCLIVIITKSKLTILNQLLKYVQPGYEEWENMLLVQYSWSIAAFAKQVCLLLLIFHLQKKSPTLFHMCFKKKCLPGLGSSIISIIFMVLLLKRLVQLVSYSLDSVHPETQNNF